MPGLIRRPKTRAIARIAAQLGINPDTLRTWVKRIEIDGGLRPGATSDASKRIADLERESRDGFGVEPICEVLTSAGTEIAPSTYYAVKTRRRRRERSRAPNWSR